MAEKFSPNSRPAAHRRATQRGSIMGITNVLFRSATSAAALFVALAASGCATYDSYYSDGYTYRDEGYTYREPYSTTSSRGDDYVDTSYGYYDDDSYWSGYNTYYSALWPTYRYHDPWYDPYYYGVSYAYHPRSSGFFGWYSNPWYDGRGWGYGYGLGYSGYAPYRHGWRRDRRDNVDYADWRPSRQDRGYRRDAAEEQADRLANRRAVDRVSYGGGGYVGGGRGYRNEGGYRDDAQRNGGYGNGAVGQRTRGFGVPVDPADRSLTREPERGNWSRERDDGRGPADDSYDTRNAEREVGYSRGRDNRGYGTMQRSEPRDRETYRETRRYEPREPSFEPSSPSYERSTPRYEMPSRSDDAPRQYAKPAYEAAPRAESYGGGWGGRGRDGGGSKMPSYESSAPSFERSAPPSGVDRGSRSASDQASRMGGRGRDEQPE